MIINHNLSSINANRVLSFKNNDVSSSLEKLASGKKINVAGDDASGLAVSEKMRAQISGLKMASSNSQNAISFIQTTEGYLSETTSILQRIRELSIQSSNGLYSSEDRMQIQVEVSQLVDEIDRIASHAQFNGLNMLTGRFAQAAGFNTPTASMWFHIGANMDQRERVYIGTMNSQGLGLKAKGGAAGTATFISISTPQKANAVIGMVDEALKSVNKQRADLGAYQNRLNHTIQGLEIGAENLQAAESRIRDTDMAKTMSELIKDQILAQAGTAMLAQANMKTQQVLSLLK